MVRVQALDRKGAKLDFEATGLYGVCIQHELDHLIGKVFLDRMTDELQRIAAEKRCRRDSSPGRSG